LSIVVEEVLAVLEMHTVLHYLVMLVMVVTADFTGVEEAAEAVKEHTQPVLSLQVDRVETERKEL
jgi:hypothetical protein